MAVNINGRMAVKTLQKEFNKEFGLALRVYDGKSFADESATLASIRKGDKTGGEISPRKNMKVRNLEDKFVEIFGIKIKVAGSDDSYLCDNNLTLAVAIATDRKKMARKAKKAERNAQNDVKETDTDSINASNDEDIAKEVEIRGREITIYTESVPLSEIQDTDDLAHFLSEFKESSSEWSQAHLTVDQNLEFKDEDCNVMKYKLENLGEYLKKPLESKVLFVHYYYYSEAYYTSSLSSSSAPTLQTKTFDDVEIITGEIQDDEDACMDPVDATYREDDYIGFISPTSGKLISTNLTEYYKDKDFETTEERFKNLAEGVMGAIEMECGLIDRESINAEKHTQNAAKETDSDAPKDDDIAKEKVIAIGIGTGGGTDEHTWAVKPKNDYSDKEKFKIIAESINFDTDEDYICFMDILGTELNNAEIIDGDGDVCIVWNNAQIVLKISEEEEEELARLKMENVPVELSYAVIKRDLDAESNNETQDKFEVLDFILDQETASFCEWEILKEW